MSSIARSARLLMLALLLAISGTLLLAQSTTDGAIGGTVYDVNGAVVANATVTVHNNGTNAEKAITTDGSGYYRVTNLPSGTYTVTINQQGFAPYKVNQVIVQVGSVTDISPRLEVGATTEVVNVTAEAPQINTTSADFAPTLNSTAISNLPINGGRWSSFAMLTPGVVSDSNGFGLLSFRGISTLLNNNTVDGADNNQAFFSEERGRTRAGYSTPKAAIEEFQVNTSNYSSEYGRSAGGVINTVTKSGTNSIHGEGYFYDRDNDWGAANAFTTINVQTAPGKFASQNFKPTDWRKIAGGAIGGPIVKDKLFFFVTYDWYKHNFPGIAQAGNPAAFFAPQTTSSPNIKTFAQNLNGLSASATPAAAQLTDALNLYNSDLAALNTMLGQVPRTGNQNILLPKIDWNISSKHHASFEVNRMRWSSPAGIQTAATVSRGISDFGNDFVSDTWGVAKLNSFFTPTLGNELRFQYGRDFEYEFSQQPSPYEVNTLLNSPTFKNPLGFAPGVVIINTQNLTIGTPNFLQRPNFPDEFRSQIADTVTWTHGNHSFKFGVDYSHVNDNSQNLFNGFGTYTYNSLVNYFTDLNVLKGCGGQQCYATNGFSQGLGLPGLEFNTNEYAFFAQDDWKILPRLSLSLGLRYEYQQLPDTVLPNTALPQTQKLPSDTNNFGPRVGFAWDVTGDGKTVLRGGYGLYYGRIINSSIFNALVNTGAQGSQISLSFSPGSTSPVFPAVLTNLTGFGKNVAFFDPNFQNPQIHQVDMTLEHDLGRGTVFSLSYLGSLGRQLPGFGDANICPGVIPGTNCTKPVIAGTFTVQPGGPITGGTKFVEPLFIQRINPAFGSETEIFSGVNSSYHALALQLNHHMSNHVQFSTSYTFSHATDFSQNQATFTDTNDLFLPLSVPNAIALEKGRSIYDVPNRFVFDAIMTSPWKHSGWAGWFTNDWQIAPIFQWQNGLPLNLTTNGTPSIASPDRAIGSGITASGGANRLDIIGRNTFRLPNTWDQDLRISKSFAVTERYRVELLTDFFNIANKQNVTSEQGVGYTISGRNLVPNIAGPNVLSTGPFGQVLNSNNNFTYTPRQIQMGARIHF
ncbi:MAG TPA: TonB-dependent receptor [Verrucomicrobiae bacterium]|nr:TonB-dependent receptor [Verrucomicrobiae bacterium]